MNILDELKQSKILLSDGAWGTFLQAKGLKPGECSELWNITRRCDVIEIAEAYLLAGSDIKGEYHTIMGVSPEEMVNSMKEAGAHIIGSNCGNGIEDMISIVKAIRTADNKIPVMIQANAGIPELIDGETVFRESPEMMASFVPGLIKAGANIIGGCCGTTPAHIREIARVLGR